MKEFDTIAAISTGLSEGGISIIRISGDRAVSIISSIFEGKNNRSIIVIIKGNPLLKWYLKLSSIS